MNVSPAELWIVEPPDAPKEFYSAVGYLLYTGVDFAFGEGDVLPSEPPESLDGIKVILVYFEDLPRIKHKLNGFMGFVPDNDPPYDLSRGSYIDFGNRAKTGEMSQRAKDWFVQTALHNNKKTWLAIYGKNALGFASRLECPLLLTGDLTLKSPAMKKHLLDRSDRFIRDVWIDATLGYERLDWGDISYNIGKALLDDYEVTGDERCLERAEDHFTRMLDAMPPVWKVPEFMPAPVYSRLFDLTGDEKYRSWMNDALDNGTKDLAFKKGESSWCHASQAFNGPTWEFLKKDTGDMGSYGELMNTAYYPVMSMAKTVGRENEFTGLIAECVKEQRKNLRDEKTGLYYHGLPGRHEGHEGFMGHGTGWSMFGLVQLLDVFPEDHPEYNDLVAIFRELCEAAAAIQDEEGAFHSILNFHWTPICRHYTCWFGHAFLRGVRIGFLDESYREKGLKAWNVIKRLTFQGGVISAAAGSPVSRRLEFYIERFGVLRLDGFLLKKKAQQPLFLLNEVLRVNS